MFLPLTSVLYIWQSALSYSNMVFRFSAYCSVNVLSTITAVAGVHSLSIPNHYSFSIDLQRHSHVLLQEFLEESVIYLKKQTNPLILKKNTAAQMQQCSTKSTVGA